MLLFISIPMSYGDQFQLLISGRVRLHLHSIQGK